VIINGLRRDRSFFIRIYNFNEIRDLLDCTGISGCKVYGDWNSSPFLSGSKRMILIARKKSALF
jgi:hypothetical protein